VFQYGLYKWKAKGEVNMITGIQSALSGLRAFATKIENNANNVANLNTEGFKKDRVILSAQAPQGVSVAVERVDTPGSFIAEQTNRGLEMIEQSNVDLSEEFPDLIVSSQGFKANLKTLQASEAMLQAVLDIKA
jgi:flagellar basal-body rod protein FlgC